MILDTVRDLGRYEGLHPLFPRAFSLIAGGGLARLPLGRHELEGSRLYVNIGHERRRPPALSPLEAHRKYIDIHVPLHGSDRIGWKPLVDCVQLRKLYDAASDVVFFSDEPAQWFTLAPGCVAVFFPEDVHAPLAGEGTILKAVFKVMKVE